MFLVNFNRSIIFTTKATHSSIFSITIATSTTPFGFLTTVYRKLVIIQTTLLTKSHFSILFRARIGFVSCMNSIMSFKVILNRKSLLTLSSLEWFFFSMNPSVLNHLRPILKIFVSEFTNVRHKFCFNHRYIFFTARNSWFIRSLHFNQHIQVKI